MSTDRDTLYHRLAEGLASDAELDAARAELDGSSWATGLVSDAFVGVEVDVCDAVLAELGLEVVPVGEAVRGEAGEVDVAAAVFAALQVDLAPVAEAVVEAAGPIDVADAVLASIGAPARTAVRPAPEPLVAANDLRRGWVVVALAAAALLALGLGGYLQGPAAEGTGVAALGAVGELRFASAAEVQIEDLSFGEDVIVFQDEGADGALILWVDEEVL